MRGRRSHRRVFFSYSEQPPPPASPAEKVPPLFPARAADLDSSESPIALRSLLSPEGSHPLKLASPSRKSWRPKLTFPGRFRREKRPPRAQSGQRCHAVPGDPACSGGAGLLDPEVGV